MHTFLLVDDCDTSNMGRQFALVFLESTKDNLALNIFAASITDSPISVIISTPAFASQSVIVSETLFGNNMKQISIPNTLQLSGSSRSNNVILITASSDIVVQGFNQDRTSCGGFLIYPINALGTSYYTMNWWPPSVKAQLGIVAVQDHTLVRVKLTRPGITINFEGRTYYSGTTMIIDMRRFEAVQLQDIARADLTGTLIEADKPIAVFSGNLDSSVPQEGLPARDQMIEQMVPTATYGTTFFVVPIPESVTGSVLDVLALYDETTVRASNTPEFTLINAGDTAPIQIATYTDIVSNKPVLVAQYVNSPRISENEDDQPAMFLVPPVSQYKRDYTFLVPPGTSVNYLMIAIEGRYQNGLILDGSPISATWSPIPDSSYVGTFVKVQSGPHRVVHTLTGIRFGAYVYGTANDECAYAFSAGTCLEVVNTVSFHSQIPEFPFEKNHHLLLFTHL